MSEVVVRLRDVSKQYENPAEGSPPLTVVSPTSLEIMKGEKCAVCGPSGSGKTTLLSLMAGLDRPSSGKIEVNGTSIENLSENQLARFRGKNMGFVFQSYYLVPTLTAIENIALPLELRGAKNARALAKEWLARVGLSNRGDHRPKHLSGGEQQRVAIARALVGQPSVVFCDEPTGNLDSENGKHVFDLLMSLGQETTLVMVTHDRQLAARMDRVIFLEDGRVV